ncbi:MAG TPA: right-handed parallel beta-helix repeat-containing protein [Dehalococcoidia bacterium]|nr:right-handed parallel beta-helix repeat-containing protein [Dehalococcoidia bacterium]
MRRAVVLLGCSVLILGPALLGNLLRGRQASASGPTTVVVSPGNMQNWAFGPDAPYYPGTGTLDPGPATPPAGLGSAHMVLSSATCPSGPSPSNPCQELLLGLGATTYGGTLLSNITSLSYSTYQTSAGVTAISLQFDIAYDVADTNWQGRLVFEPYEDPANTVSSGIWQTWTPKTGRWWATKNAASPAHPGLISGLGGKDTCTQATPCTWAQLLANWPNMGIRTGDTLLFKAGGPWPGFDGYVDNFTIGVSGSDTIYDFEATCTTDCYVRTDGNDANPGTADTPALAKKTIQAAIGAVSTGGTVHVAAGTYTENLTVAKALTLVGAGQASTTIVPAISGPTCAGGSICPGGSNVILVQASNVTIHDLTIDGDNPALTSGVVAGGADIEARNGIIADYTLGVFNNLVVHHVTVKNIYLRGIYAASGGTFNFHDDTVQNVQGSPSSISMFNFGGSGTFANNTVSGANDAISSNWSTGTQYLNNVITGSGSGVHTDNNGGSGGVADLIQGNTVSACKIDGYGVWTFAPYVSPTVQQNVVTGCAVGLAAAGQSAAVTTTFADNAVDGTGALVTSGGSTGAYITTDRFGFGTTNVSATLTGNIIKNNAVGIDADSQAGYTTTINASHNAIFGNTAGVTLTDTPTPPVVLGIGTFVLNMTPNWWGDVSGPAHALNPGGIGNSVPDGVTYSPWLGIGTDASVAPGFQLASPMTWIAGPAVCGATCIQAAIDDASNGDTVKAKTGVFNEHVTVNKSITLTAASNPIIDGGGAGDGITVTVPNVTVSSFEVRNVTNGVVVAPGATNATISTNNIHNFTSAAVRASSTTGANIASNTVNGGHVGSCIGGFWGIIVQNVSGTIGSNTVSGIGNGITTGCQEGRAIEADGSGAVQITNNNLSQYQKSGIIVRDSVNSVISGNTTTGEGPSNIIAMNGITITSTGTAAVSGNHTSGHLYVPESDFSCGILYYPVGNPAPNSVSVTGNDSTQDEVGICLTTGTATSPVSGVSVTNNTVTNHHQQAINVDTMTNVLVDNNHIDGQGGGTTATPGTTPDNDTRYYGIFAVDSTGTISNNVIKGITHGIANGIQSGVGIRLTARTGKAADMSILDNNISDVQKNAMVVTNYYGGTSVNALVRGNTVVGNGPVSYIAQNGIQISNGATAQVDANDVSGYDYVPSTWAAVGVLVLSAGSVSVTNNQVHANMEGLYVQSTANVIVTGNVFSATRDTAIFTYLSNGGTYTSNQVTGQTGSYGLYFYDASTNNVVSGNAFRANDYGVFVDYSGPGLPTGNHLNQNCIAGNTIDGVATTGTVAIPVDATQNWWGTINGANPPGHGDKINPPATIDASAFLTAPTAGCPAPTDNDGDGVPNTTDNCPNDYNPAQTNTDQFNYLSNRPGSDSLGDACDPNIAGDGYLDTAKIALGKNVLIYCPIMRADVNGDGVVTIGDLGLLAQHFGQTVPPAPARYSQDADNLITIADLGKMALVFGKSVTLCP